MWLKFKPDRRGTVHRNMYFEIKSLSVCELWLSRYFRYKKVAIWIESTGMKAIEALTVCHVGVNEFF